MNIPFLLEAVEFRLSEKRVGQPQYLVDPPQFLLLALQPLEPLSFHSRHTSTPIFGAMDSTADHSEG